MATTKFTAIYVNNESKIIEREIPGMNTYKIAEKKKKKKVVKKVQRK